MTSIDDEEGNYELGRHCVTASHGGVPALLQSEGDFVSRRSSGKKEGSRLFGEEEHRLERSSSHFKTKLGENISKKHLTMLASTHDK